MWDFTHDELILISVELHTPGFVDRPQQAMADLAPLTDTRHIPTEDEMYDVFAEMAIDGQSCIPTRLNWNLDYVIDQLRDNGYPDAHVTQTQPIETVITV